MDDSAPSSPTSTITPRSPTFKHHPESVSLERWSSVDQTDESSIYPISETSLSVRGGDTNDDPDDDEDELDRNRSTPIEDLTFGPDDDEHALDPSSSTPIRSQTSLPPPTNHIPTTWGSNFWVVLSDPLTQCTFYANPSTGDCSWDPPIGAMVIPRRLEGEWWELTDEKRGGRKYYYHTGKGGTQWTRPVGELVIPLGMIQMNALRGSVRVGEVTGSEGGTGVSKGGTKDEVKGALAGNKIARPRHHQLSPTKPILKVTTGDRTPTTTFTSASGASGLTSTLNRSHHRPEHISTDPFISLQRNDRTISTLVTPFDERRPHLPEGSPLTGTDNDEEAARGRKLGSGVPGFGPGGLKVKFDGGSLIPSPLNTPSTASSSSTISSSGINRPAFQLHSAATTSSYLPTTPNSTSDSDTGDMKNTPRAKKRSTTPKAIRQNSSSSFMFTQTQPYSSDDLGSETETEKEQQEEDSRPVPTSLSGRLFPGWAGGTAGGRRRRQSSVKTIWVGDKKLGEDSHENVLGPLEPPVRPGLRKTASDRSLRDKTRSNSSVVVSEPLRVKQAKPAISGSTRLGDGLGNEVGMKRLSTGFHPLLPETIANSIQSFRVEAYTKDYFATQRKGVLRRKISDAHVMEWQASVITGPLLSKTKTLPTEIIRAFKVIQHIMGDRDRPVDGITTVSSSSSAFSLADMAQTSPLQKDRIWNKAEKRLLLEEERWLLQLGLSALDVRDELYAMCMKQVTKNPIFSSTLRGFQLLCVLVVTFGPSNEFEPYVRSFLQTSQIECDPALRTIALHCKRKLDAILRRGPRSRPPMYSEIEQAFSAAFHPSIFGERLDHIMSQQMEAGLELPVPRILPFLAESIIALCGTRTEGIFRLPGDFDSIGEMKARLDRGEYHLTGIEDPHVLTSLLKLWLRELEEPVIPENMYTEALQASRDPATSCALVGRLPPTERYVLIFIIGFLQIFTQPRWVAFTKMTPGSLALVMAPNILRPLSMASDIVFANTAFETALIVNLLEHLDVNSADPDYTPELPNPAPRLPSTLTMSDVF